MALTVCACADNAKLSAKQGSVEDGLGEDPGYGGRGSKKYYVFDTFLFGCQAASAACTWTGWQLLAMAWELYLTSGHRLIPEMHVLYYTLVTACFKCCNAHLLLCNTPRERPSRTGTGTCAWGLLT